jgi:hypothetical protein
MATEQRSAVAVLLGLYGFTSLARTLLEQRIEPYQACGHEGSDCENCIFCTKEITCNKLESTLLLIRLPG